MNVTWAQVALHLIDQLPGILAAVGAALAAMYGLNNRKLLKDVKDQGNGQHEELVGKLDNALTENRALRGEAVIDAAGQTPRKEEPPCP